MEMKHNYESLTRTREARRDEDEDKNHMFLIVRTKTRLSEDFDTTEE